jgi:general secretion pathway protein E
MMMEIDKLIGFAYANRHGVLLENTGAGEPRVLCRQSVAPQILVEIRRMLNKPFSLEYLNDDAFSKRLSQTYQQESDFNQQEFSDDLDLDHLLQELPKEKDLLEMQDDAPVIRLLNALLAQAIKDDASDIHIEAFDQQLIVRFRIDGVLQEVTKLPSALASLLVSRVKVIAKLDIAEKRLPQDGRITIRLGGRAIDIRVSILPSSHGERVVLRILDQQASRLNLADLGMPEAVHKSVDHIVHQPHGIFLVTGPTGSGKTTTLYAALSLLNKTERNILTIEDPVEYDLPGVGQTQVNTKVGMSFARGLRAILRQDPDVVMVGEIRDEETANIAVQASLTGHLVLSTLHTNTAVGALTRLSDMNVQPFLLASSLLGVLAQRLIRTLCSDCKQAAEASAKECEFLGVETATIYQPKGCEQCRHTGYVGRTGIYELIVVDEILRNMIHDNAGEQTIKAYAHEHVKTIHVNGADHVLAGDTSMAEVLRVTSSRENV